MKTPRRIVSTYARIFRTYLAWAPVLLLLALIVFVPLGLVDAVAITVNLEALDPSEGIKLAAAAVAVTAISATGLLGEIFFSGAIAISLTHPEGERQPSLRVIARRVKYGRLVAVDILFVLIVGAGLLLGAFPGLLAFVFLSLAGPVVEIEERSVHRALLRSAQLVRGSFWLVFWIVVPIELVGDGVGAGLDRLAHAALGHGFLASWLAEAAANVVLSPLFAVAAVLLTVDLIGRRDGAAPPLKASPTQAQAPA